MSDSETEITISYLARLVAFMAAAAHMKHLHRRKVKKLFAPYAATSAKNREFLPFTDEELALLSDHEALWNELKRILKEEETMTWALTVDPAILNTDEFKQINSDGVSRTLCLFRTMQSFGMFPGYT